jgi:hypothetical protein
MFVNYALVWSITYDRNCSFKVLATVITIVNYDRKTFIVQATELISTRRSSVLILPFQ